ncbi:MAG: hypothetical protein QNJ54_32565 [Prochloraceae cyanobacterium]|nr:hypothetical protein [Prochloraceae cyanobacterium]
MFLGKLFILTAEITIILLSQLSFLPSFNLDIVESSFSNPLSALDSDARFQSSADTKKTIVSNICYQDLTIQCLRLLSMSSGQPVSEIDSPMKITFRQSGGFAGLIKGCEIDTELLSSEEAKELKSLVNQSDVFEAQSQKSPNVADAYSYQIVIETRERTHQVSFDEPNLSEEVIPLIDFLKDRSDYIKQNNPN